MKVCSHCRHCFDDSTDLCTDESHPPLSETRNGSPEMIAGYQLEYLLESRGKIETYRASRTDCGQSCLVKILAPDAQSSQRFLDEGKLAAAFFHPNLTDVYEAGSLASGEVFVVVEATNEQTLRDLLNTVGVPELLTSIEIVRQTAEALHAIHQKGLVHLAVRPENIILSTDPDGGLLVRMQNIDFGGAAHQSIVSNKFLIDSFIDSIRYFAPEQCSGEQVSVKTDVYSLGVVFYEMLAGVPPFDAAKASGLIEKHRSERPPEIKIDNFELRMLITHTLMESLGKRPEGRQSSANAFARQLRHMELLETHVSTPPPAVVVTPALTRPPVSVVAAAPAQPAIIKPAVVAETAEVIQSIQPVTAKSEPAKIALFESPADDLPEIPYLSSSGVYVDDRMPIIANSAAERTEPAVRHFSRLKLRRKKLHSKSTHPAQEISEPKNPPTHLQIQRVSTEIESVPAKPALIEWDQPEDDIPSIEDVMEVLSKEQVAQARIIEPQEITTVLARIEPKVVEWDLPEDDIPSMEDVMEVLATEQISEVLTVKPEREVIVAAAPKAAPRLATKAKPKEIPVEVDEPEEITAVREISRPIRIEWDQPIVANRFAAAGQASNEFLFLPTILGDRTNRTSIDADPGDSMFSAFYDSSKPGFAVPYRSIAIGGGLIAVIAMFVFGSDLLGRYALTEGTGDSVAATKALAPETFTQPSAALPSKKTELKSTDKPLQNIDGSETKPVTVKTTVPRSDDKSEQQTSKATTLKSSPIVPTKLVISSDNGKINLKTEQVKKSAESVQAKTTGATRPRIVRDPKP